MYLGRIVEIAPPRDLYDAPLHPYTEALLSAVPIPDPAMKRQRIVCRAMCPTRSGRPPAAISTRAVRSASCRSCSTEKPALRQTHEGHWVACHLRG